MFCILHLDVSLLGAVKLHCVMQELIPLTSSKMTPLPAPLPSFIVHYHSAFKSIMVTTWRTFLIFSSYVQHKFIECHAWLIL